MYLCTEIRAQLKTEGEVNNDQVPFLNPDLQTRDPSVKGKREQRAQEVRSNRPTEKSYREPSSGWRRSG